MQKPLLSLLVLMILSQLSWGYTIYEPGYTVEHYVTFSPGWSQHMTFDDSGNLYTIHKGSGNITKIAPDKTMTNFASGLHGIDDIVWTGGTAFGDHLYVNVKPNSIKKIDLNGNITHLGNITEPSFMGIDRSGLFGGNVIFGISGQDALYQINTSNQISLFNPWPTPTGGGGPEDMAMKLGNTGPLAGRMFLTGHFTTSSLNSGLFEIDTNGNVTRFTNAIGAAKFIDIDHTGAMFGGDMFVDGTDIYGSPDWGLWRVNPNGQATLFGERITNFTFGPDGALYIAQAVNGMTEVSRIVEIPEPLTISLIGIGGLMISRKRRVS